MKIDCVTAVTLSNLSRPLTDDERNSLDQHLVECYQCREEQICCSEALELIDQLPIEEVEHNPALLLHVSCCPECCAAKEIEPSLREVFSPEYLPGPSMQFEALLAAKLNIGLNSNFGEAPDIARDANDRFMQWSWAIAALTIALFISTRISETFSFFSNLPNAYYNAMGYIASHLTGQAAVVYSCVTRYHCNLPIDTFSLVMIASMLVISFSAFRFFAGELLEE